MPVWEACTNTYNRCISEGLIQVLSSGVRRRVHQQDPFDACHEAADAERAAFDYRLILNGTKFF
jgi:hypothetical protein